MTFRCALYDPLYDVSGCACRHISFALVSTPFGTFLDIAILAAASALTRPSAKSGSGRGSSPYKNLFNMLPNFPCGRPDDFTERAQPS